jgi:hypothetical protein
MKYLLVSTFIWLYVIGCPPLERDAYNTVVGANASIKSIRAKHPECASPTSTPACVLIEKATAAKDALIDAAEVYCAGPAFDSSKGTCQPPAKGTPAQAQAAAKLQAALASWKQVAADLKGIQ